MTNSLLTSAVCASFTVNAYAESANAYTMVAEDPAHFLMCKLILEVQEQEAEESWPGQKKVKPRKVICHFPKIVDAQLKDFVWHNVTLYGIVMVTFQMKVLEKLFFFCADQGAASLVIAADASHAKDLGIYRDFLAFKNRSIISTGDPAGLVIPVDQGTFDDWMDFIEIVTLRFEQILCRGQKTNVAIQRYLKLRGLAGV